MNLTKARRGFFYWSFCLGICFNCLKTFWIYFFTPEVAYDWLDKKYSGFLYILSILIYIMHIPGLKKPPYDQAHSTSFGFFSVLIIMQSLCLILINWLLFTPMKTILAEDVVYCTVCFIAFLASTISMGNNTTVSKPNSGRR